MNPLVLGEREPRPIALGLGAPKVSEGSSFFMSQMGFSPSSYPRNAPRGTEPLHVRAGKRISLCFPQGSLYEVFLLVLQEVIPVLL